MSEVQLSLKHGDRTNHKYVMKIGNRYFYSMDEVKEFKKRNATAKGSSEYKSTNKQKKIVGEISNKNNKNNRLNNVISKKTVFNGQKMVEKARQNREVFAKTLQNIIQEEKLLKMSRTKILTSRDVLNMKL